MSSTDRYRPLAELGVLEYLLVQREDAADGFAGPGTRSSLVN
ncbi:MAG: hypothetical protein QOF30_584 [Acidimicrobiaceae bacterium]|jgi:hypothetical protein|nr:hypothetical protein [Acidimicrobiaceae bacterium]